ncbi:unnamed protein product, partial [Aphanomyces euteiches]
CFPHCCPIHSYGNFCSASIDLVASNVDHAMHDVYAFARFQGAQEHVFQPDEIVPATMFLSSLRTPGDLKGEWLPSSSSAYNQSKKEMIFHLNLAQSNENSTNPLTMERHLTILYAFLSMPSVHFFASQLQTLENRILKSLLQPMGASMTFNAYQRRSMPFPTSIVRPGVVLFGPVNTDLESLKAFCVDMVRQLHL